MFSYDAFEDSERANCSKASREDFKRTQCPPILCCQRIAVELSQHWVLEQLTETFQTEKKLVWRLGCEDQFSSAAFQDFDTVNCVKSERKEHHL